MRMLLALSATLLISSGAFAQDASPEGEWRDEFGTTVSVSHCGDDGTQVCVVLLDVQGDSRTEENLAYVNEQIMQAEMTAPNEWQGTVIFEGSEAQGTLTQVEANTIEVQGCRAGIFCETLAFQRV